MDPLKKQIIIFSAFILLNSGPYNSFSSLLNYIHKSHGQIHSQHAQIFFIFNSIASISFSLLIPNINIISLKKVSFFIPLVFLIVYTLTLVSFLIGNATVILIFTGIQSIFAGLGSSLIWVISGRYINNSCEIFKAQDKSAKCFGIFSGFMACSFLFGSLLSAGSLQIFSQKHNIYFVFITTCLIAFIILHFFVKDVNSQLQNSLHIKGQQQANLEIPIIVEQSQSKSTIFSPEFKCNKTCIFKNMSIYRKMITLYPYQILSGIISGYIFHCSEDYVLVPEGENKDTFLTVNLIFLGIGGVVGSYLSGYLGDKIKQKKLFLIGTAGYLISFFMGIISLQAQLTYISLITGFFSGATLMYGNNMLTIICSKVYGGGIQTFAGNRLMINMSVIIFNIVIGFIPTQKMRNSMYVILIILMVLSILSLYLIKYLRERPEQQQKQQMQKQKQKQIELEKRQKIQEKQKQDLDDSATNTMKLDKQQAKDIEIIV